LAKYLDHLPAKKRAFEVAGGIGRVTKILLVDIFEEIDLLDQSPVMVEQAKKEVPYVKNFYC